ncbi:unnamed protein product [Alopecurus aequalis]
MYVTRPLAGYHTAAADQPPEGPGSGFLVVVDETGETARRCCLGQCVDREMRSLPFPQNRQLALRENSSCNPLDSFAAFVDVLGEIVGKFYGIAGGRAPGLGKGPKIPDYSMLVPVVGQPLSSRRYYVVRADGQHWGMVSACSREEDKTDCCCCSCINDVKPRPFDRSDVYQQVEVQQQDNGFVAVAVASDGIPPHYLRKKGWKVNTMKSPEYNLASNAQGVDDALRSRMPDLDSLNIVERSSPPVGVGKWYIPFMFVKADAMFVNPDGSKTAELAVTATVRRSTSLLGGTTNVVPEEKGQAVWFRPSAAAVATMGLDMVVWEKMKWELERGGWVAPGNGNEERIERVERRDGLGQWQKFACYVLVERFVLKRMDGTLALTCEFRHTDKIRAKWL